jgi:ketosteroid isomerase-like protein
MIFGGLGGHERGYPEVFNRLRWAATKVNARLVRIENLSTVVEGTMAVTADLQHMVRIVDGLEHPRILRVTLGWRMEEDGWRIFCRHGDEYRPSGREGH